LIAETQRYYFTPSEERRKLVEMVLGDLRKAGPRLPPALRAGFNRLDDRVQQVLKAKPSEEALFTRLGFMTAGPRVDSLTGAYSRELESALHEQAFYRSYLVAYSGALLILIGYLALRLIASYRLLNAANEVAVEQFLAGRLPFGRIAAVIESALTHHTPAPADALAAVLAADGVGRRLALEAACC